MVDMVHQLKTPSAMPSPHLTIQRTVKMSGREKRAVAGEALFFLRAGCSKKQA